MCVCVHSFSFSIHCHSCFSSTIYRQTVAVILYVLKLLEHTGSFRTFFIAPVSFSVCNFILLLYSLKKEEEEKNKLLQQHHQKSVYLFLVNASFTSTWGKQFSAVKDGLQHVKSDRVQSSTGRRKKKCKTKSDDRTKSKKKMNEW